MLAIARSSGYAAPVKTRRFVVLITVLVVMTALVEACSNADQTATTVASATSSAPVSPSPAAVVIGDCTIEPQTQCPGAQLQGALIPGADLHGANLSGANLQASDLRRTDLTGADLSDADLSDTDLSHAKVLGADLTGAKLKHANLEGTDFTGATLRVSQLNTARLCETTMPDGTNVMTGCGLPSPTVAPGESPSPSPVVEPSITNFSPTSPSVVCPSSPPDEVVDVTFNFATQNATSAEFLLDGASQAVKGGKSAERGAVTLSFPCSQSQHKYTMIASGNSGTPDKTVVTVYRS